MKTKISSAELFGKAKVGLGVTQRCGSDTYGYFIASVDPKTKTIGLYTPNSWFKNNWTEGHMEHDPFDPNAKPDLFVQAYRGKWYELYENNGKRRWPISLNIGYCNFYQDPSL